jgi:hypothetical protein
VNLDEYLSAVPPSCLAGLRPEKGPDTGWWGLRCACGSDEGAVLGHPLGPLKPDVAQEYAAWLVSPLSFRCDTCGQTTEFLDTAVHGEGARFASYGGGVGCCAIRGEGEPTPAACPRCQRTRVWANAIFNYHDDRIQDFLDDPNFALVEYFDWFTLECVCTECGHVWRAAEIETK